MLVPVLYNNKKIYIAAAIIIYIYSTSIFTVFRVPGTWPDMIPGISISYRYRYRYCTVESDFKGQLPK